MNSRYIRFLQVLLASFDVLAVSMVFLVAELVFKDRVVIEGYPGYASVSASLSIAWLLVSIFLNVYHRNNILSFELFTRRSMQALAVFFLVLAFYQFLVHQVVMSRAFVLVFVLSMLAAILINRFLYLAVQHYFKNKDFLMDRVVILGYNDVSKKIIQFLEEKAINKEVIGICDEAENVRELSHYPILSNINNAIETCKKYKATEIYSSIAPEYNPEIYKMMQLADQHCIHFKIVPDISVFVNRRCHIDYMSDLPVLSVRNEPLEDLGNRIKKSIFDMGISILVLVLVLSWLIPLIGLIIWLDSGGPIFFTQKRSGKGNRKFSCIKFRSMRVNAQANELQATRNDQRFTRVGRFLRRTNLDEFPQFLNVLRGDMSIVGPRPHMLKHTVEFSQIVDQYMVRHFLKPGITGWAQVNGYRGEIDSVEKLERRIEHDLWYLEHWSVWLDLKILFLTFFSILKGDKNAF